ncbi:hypothetical protein GCM10009727_12690 [Actinomadura napierensis]|uniref:Uncharacterized protein n=1 Tax=Actinomadura napierensis TaxID=267854 RepID=A0ABN2YBA2_9ACTN
MGIIGGHHARRLDVDRSDEVSAALLADLRSTITSDRVLADGPEYVRSMTLFNAAVDIRPAVVVRLASTACRCRYAVADTTSGDGRFALGDWSSTWPTCAESMSTPTDALRR